MRFEMNKNEITFIVTAANRTSPSRQEILFSTPDDSDGSSNVVVESKFRNALAKSDATVKSRSPIPSNRTMKLSRSWFV
jgi:hypothetical protein